MLGGEEREREGVLKKRMKRVLYLTTTAIYNVTEKNIYKYHHLLFKIVQVQLQPIPVPQSQ